MADRFERFTERARKVLMLAQQEAQRLNHNYIGTEHLLLGLLVEGNGIAARVLMNLGLDLQKTRQVVEAFIVAKGDESQSNQIGLNPRAKKVIELAYDEARLLGHHYIGTEHLLLGLVREGQGIGAGTIEVQNVQLTRVREAVIAILNQSTYTKQTFSTSTDSVLAVSGTDLTEQARMGKLDPLIGREAELKRVIQVLGRRNRNNVVLVGKPGVGKTALVEGLAQHIAETNTADFLYGKKLIAIGIGPLVAHSQLRGKYDQFEARLGEVINEIKQANAILFIDELQALVIEGDTALLKILQFALQRSETLAIAAINAEDYYRYPDWQTELEKTFQPVLVREPTAEETLAILRGVKDRYEAFHDVIIEDEALQMAVEIAANYTTRRSMPDKAIDLMDEAASTGRINQKVSLPHIKELMQHLHKVIKAKETAIAQQQLDLASELSKVEDELTEQITKLETEQAELREKYKPRITVEDVKQLAIDLDMLSQPQNSEGE